MQKQIKSNRLKSAGVMLSLSQKLSGSNIELARRLPQPDPSAASSLLDKLYAGGAQCAHNFCGCFGATAKRPVGSL